MLIIYLSLGVIQAITEFLPISSSHHLGLARFGMTPSEFTDVVIALHGVTLLAAIFYFRKPYFKIMRNKGEVSLYSLIMLLILGTLPLVILGLLIKDIFEFILGNSFYSSMFLVLNGVILLLPEKHGERTLRDLTIPRALFAGAAQALGALPGISRSGVTYRASLLAGLTPKTAFFWTFSLYIPAVIGASVYRIRETSLSFSLEIIPAVIVCFFLSLGALWVFEKFALRQYLKYFGIYCLAAGAAGIWFFLPF